MPPLGPRSAEVSRLRRQIRDRKRGDDFIVVEGMRLVSEALNAGMVPTRVVIGEKSRSDLVDVLGHIEVRPLVVVDDAFKSLCSTVSPQPLLSLFTRPKYETPTTLETDDLLLVSVGVADPGNLGTMIRAAAAVRASGVLTFGGVDPWAQKTLRSSAGTAFKMEIVDPGIDDPGTDIATRLAELRQLGARVVATAANAETVYSDLDLSGAPVAIVVGSESQGLHRDSLGDQVDDWVRIPMAPGVESLNVAMATTLMLYEARRAAGQRL